MRGFQPMDKENRIIAPAPSPPPDLRRGAVIGTSCSGKSTFASHLAQRMGAPHIELDALYWRPEWIPAPRDEFRALTGDAISAESWVVDGNYSAVRDLVWGRATAVIWLNYSFPVMASRALRRTFHRVFTRQELWSGNRETFVIAFLSRYSILWWVLTTYRRHRREFSVLLNEPGCKHRRIVFHSPRDAEQFLESMRR